MEPHDRDKFRCRRWGKQSVLPVPCTPLCFERSHEQVSRITTILASTATGTSTIAASSRATTLSTSTMSRKCGRASLSVLQSARSLFGTLRSDVHRASAWRQIRNTFARSSHDTRKISSLWESMDYVWMLPNVRTDISQFGVYCINTTRRHESGRHRQYLVPTDEEAIHYAGGEFVVAHSRVYRPS